ncbi:MAG TPA: hypothetical protein PLA50_05260 [Bacteroidia bacterium]|nr:hypothetical protein [Bacteroidia bacterium]
MKIGCHCGATLIDQTDDLPHKGHLIPDQEWFPVYDGIDAVIDDVAAGRTDAEAAYMKVRILLGAAARHVYQCKACGRLFVDDRWHQLHTFVPASAETCKEILRSRDGDGDA